MNIMSEDETLKATLEALKQEHRALDEEITQLSDAPAVDPLAIRRLKKRKLALKDQISRLEDQIYPDIIA